MMAKIILVSSTYDYTTDFISFELEKRNIKYLRIDRDRFDEYRLKIDINKGKMEILYREKTFNFDFGAKYSIYFRAPTFLRDSHYKKYTITEQLYRSQWSAFIRNLSLFSNSFWMNNPLKIYETENKLKQLYVAKQNGLIIPETYFTNSNIKLKGKIVLKTLDTALVTKEGKESFVYANIIDSREVAGNTSTKIPFIVQKLLSPKIDIRVVVIDNKIYAFKILRKKMGIEGDWRVLKDELSYEPFQLPDKLKQKLIKYVLNFGLSFGAIDLAYSNNRYYFLEINPTGEWGWLVNTSKERIDLAICDLLISKGVN